MHISARLFDGYLKHCHLFLSFLIHFLLCSFCSLCFLRFVVSSLILFLLFAGAAAAVGAASAGAGAGATPTEA